MLDRMSEISFNRLLRVLFGIQLFLVSVSLGMNFCVMLNPLNPWFLKITGG